ncbi:MAG TPA: methionine--tRNA ligase [Mycobacteriales bacterium]|nr:methionine--tRNA ligase [Mycobacteriales bacterium]
MSRHYLTTTIPYVNAAPHLGFALELVQADVLARHRRLRGGEVRFLSGTDDNSLKNVLAAEAAGVPVREFVDRNADRFAAIREPLALSFDDFIRTSKDPRHRPGVERFWAACVAAGDIYQKHYEGLYCVGCEQFYTAEELVGGLCPEHGTAPEWVSERNWFFRLSRYQDRLLELIESDRLRIQPTARRNEVIAFIRSGLRDLSISRSQDRARGWGIPVPADPSQVIWVWWDALCNYLTTLNDADFQHWWAGSDRRVHHIGKGVVRFHAVYWPAMLLSAGIAEPTDILVHDYLTVNGQKLSKSAGNVVDPVELVERYGTDAVRWWLLREVPRLGDADFTVERLIARSNADLAGGVGNLTSRVTSMVHRYRDGVVPETEADPLGAGVEAEIDAAVEEFDFRGATAALWRVVEDANRLIEATRPWELAKDPGKAAELDQVLGRLVAALRLIAAELAPFLPDAAGRIAEQCRPVNGVLPEPAPLFPRF